MKILVQEKLEDCYDTLFHYLAYLFGKHGETIQGNLTHNVAVIAYKEFFGYRTYTECRVMTNNSMRRLVIYKIFGKSNTDKLIQWRV